jgi:hypothetical protein
MPVDLTGEDQIVRERNVLHTITDRTTLAELGTHGTHGECLLEGFQEPMSAQLVHGAVREGDKRSRDGDTSKRR